ncbi:Piso0_005236 [Millerozyma farinosa CBS 7064]|uniref:Piso0_005236 protein n=1 Tax=Pichia sorbitophila (strain ATCC MYA-4447 / BCRC 22081 / CBS 7064 / NBRC 10061 / NRRL Y-12695) TaxID=559304 RepID=G8Y4K2_PICSO|nr:Piso0_005236 [Millerozyma farinosa CBS 7064]
MCLLSFAAHFSMTNYQPVICYFASENKPAAGSKRPLKNNTKIHNNSHLCKALLEAILELSYSCFHHLKAIALNL